MRVWVITDAVEATTHPRVATMTEKRIIGLVVEGFDVGFES